MEKYKFIFNGQTYELGEDNCYGLINDEEHPVTGIEVSDILELLRQQEEGKFDIEYYDQPCSNCRSGKEGKEKYFKFLEYHHYLFTKKGQYVLSSISPDYKTVSVENLLKSGKIDNSYIVSIIVCVNCGDYSIEIEQFEV